MSEYGYIPESPAQSVKNNKGIFTTNDIYDLVTQDKWLTFGQLELIETKTVTSSTASIIFSDIKEDIYDVHFVTWNNFQSTVANKRLVMRFYESGTEESASVYQWSYQTMGVDFEGENQTTSDSSIFLGTNTTTTSAQSDSGYVYIYNAGDSTKYTFTSSHATGLYQSGPHLRNHFGGAALPQTSVVDQFKFFSTATSNIEHVVMSLYGIRYS